MMKKTLAAAAAAALVGMGALVPAGAAPGIDGLWDATTTGGAVDLVADCGEGGGPRAIDANDFCVIDDYGSVELGVKFTTSEQVAISGIRAYRVDSGEVTGTLWTADGEKLASGVFAGTETNSWQDLTFEQPVTIVPEETYVASYFSPNADYAYEWFYFTGTARTSGPLTATASVEGDRNGVFCYGTSCGLPTQTYKDTNYWVTPVIFKHAFSGFQQAIDTAGTNEAKAGRAIPVKFSLGGDMGLDILREGYPKATPIACEAGEATATIEEAVSSSASGLQYDQETGEYMYVWKTAKSMANKCYKFDLGLDDLSSYSFTVKFTR